MRGSAKFKVPNGKLLEVRVEYDGSVRELQILGDFFIYPEGSLRDIEELLVGTQVGEGEGGISGRIQHFVEANNVTFVGITSDSVAKTLIAAVSGGNPG